MFIDSHAHIYLDAFTSDLEDVCKAWQEMQVECVLMPNIDVQTIELMKIVHQRYPDKTKMMLGLHPCSVKADFKDQLRLIRDHLDDNFVVAIGEIGIDLHWDKSFKSEQIEAFKHQINWAVELDLPIVIHSRASLDLVLDLLELWEIGQLTGVFHCFGGNREQLNRIVKLGFMIGIGGVYTFKNSQLRNVLISSDLKDILLETDAPYLAPVPYRGKRNEPSYVSIVAAEMAREMSISIDEVGINTTKNARRLFRL